MKKILRLGLLFFFLGNVNLNAQILNFSAAIQEQDQWCWAGASKSILDYYGDTTLQCEIAEYTRSVATWHSFGNTDCCNDPTQGCNYWNYNYGYSGSIEDILVYFGGIANYGTGSYRSEQQIADDLSLGRPFVIRWGWYSGGGHFVVGYGKSNSTIYYMNPWFGEGLKFADYSWVKDDGIHQWTHTNVITTSPVGINEDLATIKNDIYIFPNPSDGNFTIKLDRMEANTIIEIYNSQGQKVFSKELLNQESVIELNNLLESGLYFMKIIGKNNIQYKKVLIN
jgi:hypothetical protein